jgi:putative acetyltransferase
MGPSDTIPHVNVKSLPVVLLAAAVLVSCNHARDQSSSKFVVVSADHTTAGASRYPVAVDLSKVGTYPADVHSGAGYFYDEVLEYRVWLHPDKGAKALNGDDDYFVAYAQYEPAEAFSKTAPGAEQPIVLVRQLEWISEPEHERFIPKKEERITEWQVQWLTGNKRGPSSIQEFLKHPTEAGPLRKKSRA